MQLATIAKLLRLSQAANALRWRGSSVDQRFLQQCSLHRLHQLRFGGGFGEHGVRELTHLRCIERLKLGE